MNLFKKIEKQKPIEQVIEESVKEAEEALENPYVFEKPIKNVAVIGAGPSGVSIICFYCDLDRVITFCVYIVTSN
jgi:NADH dehydrogenase FAD-containing subunit